MWIKIVSDWMTNHTRMMMRRALKYMYKGILRLLILTVSEERWENLLIQIGW